MKIRLEIDRSSWLWRPIGRASRILVLAVSMLLIASVAFAGWTAVVATMTGSINTAAGLSGNFTGVGSCSITAGPGTAVFGSASGLAMTFSGAGWTPDTRVRCSANFINTSGRIIALSTVVSAQPWAAVSSPDMANWNNNEDKAARVDIVPSVSMPEGATGTPLVITLTWVPGS